MESDYVEHEYVDLLTLKDVIVKKEFPTTYIHISNPKGQFEITGHLSYQ
jgi:hypothetical protein